MSGCREYEVKMSIAPDAVERLLSHPVLTAGTAPRPSSRVVSTYFDTPDALLRRKRVSLRVRQSDAGTVHTLKAPGASLVDRAEWEVDDASTRPNRDWLQSTPLKSLFKGDGVVGSLDARFTVDVARTTVPIVFAESTIEGALDQGAVRAKNVSLPLCEFELELKHGAEESVIALARLLARDLPLVLSLSSKAERGYGVADLSWGVPTKEIAVDLSSVRTIADAVAAVMQGCLHAICRNAALIGGAEDESDAVHKTRISLRHLRAAFTFFEPVLRRRSTKALAGELKWISDKLGAARDADVFQHGTFDEAAAADQTNGTGAVAGIMRAGRDTAHRDLRAAIASARWRHLLLDLLAFSGDGVRRSRRDARAAPFARKRLAELHRSLAKRTRGWAHHSEDEMHDVRKAAKMLRYDLDLLATLPKLGIRQRTVCRLGQHLQTVQQTLGDAHDTIALREHLGEVILRRAAPPGTPDAQWAPVHDAARRIAEAAPQDNDLLGKAHRAAKRLRRQHL